MDEIRSPCNLDDYRDFSYMGCMESSVTEQWFGSEFPVIFCAWLTGFRGDFTVISGRGVAGISLCRDLIQGC